MMVMSFLTVLSCTTDQQSGRMPVTTDSELALELYETGMLAFDQIKLKMAHENLKLAVNEDPDFFMAYFWIYFLSSERSKKVADLALNVGAELNDAEKEIRTAFKYLMDGQNAKVVEHLNLAIDKYPADPHIHKILYILQYQYLKDTEGAIESMERAIAAQPDYALAYNQLGYAYMDLGEYDKADAAFEKYLDLAPDIANPHDSRGDYYMATGQYGLAFESYMNAYRIDSSFTMSAKKAGKARELQQKAD